MEEERVENVDRYLKEHISKSDIEEIIGNVIQGYKISERMLYLYQRAFVHKSVTNKIKNLEGVPKYMEENNERMECLGDSILGASTKLYFFHKYPTLDQGNLTKISNRIVCGTQCTKFAKKIGMSGKILMTEKTERMQLDENDRFLEDAFESLICAMFLEHGMGCTDLFMKNIIEKYTSESEYLRNTNYKAMLLDYCQNKKFSEPTYEIMSQEMEEGNRKIFCIVVKIGKERKGVGSGKKVKEAQMKAAKHALERMNLLKKLEYSLYREVYPSKPLPS